MLIFDIDFKGHSRSAVKTLKVVSHLKMFLEPLRCNMENFMILWTFAQSLWYLSLTALILYFIEMLL